MASRSLHQIQNCVLPDSIISKKFGGEKILAFREDAAEINRIGVTHEHHRLTSDLSPIQFPSTCLAQSLRSAARFPLILSNESTR